eukprot:6173881-Pleurochrysis_carterae.AAC.2
MPEAVANETSKRCIGKRSAPGTSRTVSMGSSAKSVPESPGDRLDLQIEQLSVEAYNRQRRVSCLARARVIATARVPEPTRIASCTARRRCVSVIDLQGKPPHAKQRLTPLTRCVAHVMTTRAQKGAVATSATAKRMRQMPQLLIQRCKEPKNAVQTGL